MPDYKPNEYLVIANDEVKDSFYNEPQAQNSAEHHILNLGCNPVYVVQILTKIERSVKITDGRPKAAAPKVTP